MIKKMKKYNSKIALAVVLILILTNPSPADFDRFSGCSAANSNEKCGRTAYALIFSVYHFKDTFPALDRFGQQMGVEIFDKRYIGICNNFIPARTYFDYIKF